MPHSVYSIEAQDANVIAFWKNVLTRVNTFFSINKVFSCHSVAR